MSSQFQPELPNILPLEEVIVEDESFTFTTFQGDAGQIIEQTEYLLEKAPIQRIESVSGVLDGEVIDFEKGVDYELSQDNEKIVWLDGGDSPDPASMFYVTYRSESVMGRYISSHTDELDTVQADLEDIIESRFVDSAEGEELDRIGDIFGKLGRRLDRTDEEYRIYLKSVVQSFISRGTRNDIKKALSAATGVAIDDITIDENFEDNEYDVSLPPKVPITGSLIEEISDVAGPSGVNQAITRFEVGPDETKISDSSQFSEGIAINFDELSIDDDISVDGNKTESSDAASVDDSSKNRESDPGRFKWSESDSSGDDWSFMQWTEITSLGTFSPPRQIVGTDVIVELNANRNTVPDELDSSDDVVADIRPPNDFDWSDSDGSGDSWSLMQWSEITSLGVFDAGSHGTGVTDSGAENPNNFTGSDESLIDDTIQSVSVSQNAYWGNSWSADSTDTSLLWTP